MKRSVVRVEGRLFEILSSNGRVWVNGPDGASVARYSAVAGRDVHHTVEEQRVGAGQCLDCAADVDYRNFVDSVEKHYGVRIPEKHSQP